jgi:hypothetical protein
VAADVTIATGGTVAAPLDYPIPGAAELLLKCLTADYDGSGAAGPYVPAVQLMRGPNVVVGTFPLDQQLAAGVSADVSWFPGVTAAPAQKPGQSILVYDYTVTGSSKRTIDTAVDGPYAGPLAGDGVVLEIFSYSQTTEAAAISTFNMNFNNDFSASYDKTYIDNANNALTVGGNFAQTSWQIYTTGASAPSTEFGHFSFLFYNYADTIGHKVGQVIFGHEYTGFATSEMAYELLHWTKTAAVSRIAFVPATAGINFQIGTRVSIFTR